MICECRWANLAHTGLLGASYRRVSDLRQGWQSTLFPLCRIVTCHPASPSASSSCSKWPSRVSDLQGPSDWTVMLYITDKGISPDRRHILRCDVRAPCQVGLMISVLFALRSLELPLQEMGARCTVLNTYFVLNMSRDTPRLW